MNTIRAFIAVEIDAPNKEKLVSLISDLKQSNADVKWANENQLHMTLKFLGNIEETKIQEISNALKSITKNLDGFSIMFSRIGAFPNINQPRVIWIGIDKGKEELKFLSGKIEIELEKLGFAKEKHDYRAHLTLGRVRSSKNIPILTKLINETDFQSQEEIKIDRIILFQSTLTPKGAIYTSLTEVHFKVQPC